MTSNRFATSRLAILTLALAAALFAVGALAQDHGGDHDDHGAAGHAEQADHGQPAGQGHGEAYPDDPHGEDPAHTAADAHHGEGAHGDTHGDAHGDDHGGGHGGMPHLPNMLTFIKLIPGLPQPVIAFLERFQDPIFSILVAALMTAFFISLGAKLSAREPGRLQMAVEMLFGGLYSLFQTIIGDTARRYTPFLGTLFIFIWFNNLFALVPLGHASTSSFANTTFGLGLLTFLYVQGVALKENGIGGYLHHMAGSPKTRLDWVFSGLLFPLHLLGELIKPISLSLRLFGNIFGEDTLVATMVLLGAGISWSLSGGLWFIPGLPLQFPFYFLGLLSSTIQALVFTLLATVYIALWLPHGHDEEAHGH